MRRNGYPSHAQLLKTLGHPARLRILSALQEGEECVCHLTAVLKQRQAYVSQQLIFLRRAGLIKDRRDGQRVYYRVRDARVFDLINDLEKLTGQSIGLTNPRRVLDCSCPKCEVESKRSK